jgi:hypothetical protein
MTTAYLLIFCRITVAMAFTLSAAGKAANFQAFQTAIRAFKLLPAGWSAAAAGILLIAEAGVVLLTIVGGSFLVAGFTLAAILLVIFSAGLAYALVQKRRVACNCFGPSVKRISVYDLVRNAGLLISSLSGLSIIWPVERLGYDPTPAEVLLVGLIATIWTTILINLTDIAQVYSSRPRHTS